MELLQQKAQLLRKLSLLATTEAGSGHPTSCLSAADITAVLFEKYFTYDLSQPLNAYNDRFILSKGHAAPLFYALYALSGAFPVEELSTLRKFTSPLEGHPTPEFSFTDAATGSLGQGLSVGVGMAYVLKKELHPSPTIYVLLGDGELAEGQIWEAANFASHNQLDNVVVIADINRLGQSEETMFGHHMEQYEARFKGFGFDTTVIDGHNLEEIDAALQKATTTHLGMLHMILAKTYKGKGISFLENKDNWHGKALKKEDLEKALEELGELDESVRFRLKNPSQTLFFTPSDTPVTLPTYHVGDQVATREAYGDSLSEMVQNTENVYVLDADMKNSTFSEAVLEKKPEVFVECFIAEQNMVSMAVGVSRLGKKPFVSTFDSFITRALDQIRLAAISKATISICGSHIGVSIGEDGPSQMGLENVGFFATIPGMLIIEPSDATSTAKLMPLILQYKGVSYLRTLRPKVPVLYDSEEEFVIGGSKVLRSSSEDVLTVVATGITVHEALEAYERLKQEGILIRVVDCYSLKPIDALTLKSSVKETKMPLLITVEDHFDHGGLGDLVLAALSQEKVQVTKLALTHISRSGTKEELLSDAGISADSIVTAVKTHLA